MAGMSWIVVALGGNALLRRGEPAKAASGAPRRDLCRGR
jgi:carbamate kinase